ARSAARGLAARRAHALCPLSRQERSAGAGDDVRRAAQARARRCARREHARARRAHPNGELSPATAGPAPMPDVVPDPVSDSMTPQAPVGLAADEPRQRPRRLSVRALAAGIVVALVAAGTLALALATHRSG